MWQHYVSAALWLPWAFVGFQKPFSTPESARQPTFKHFFVTKPSGKLKIAQFMEFSLDLIASHIPIP